ncbi:uncharacterized protein TRIADDRAFT_50321 [Trichoplax adhaerens]|uniref:Calnexin n=1 Tax=Trichoplax adhaerens TaxID=10228 RepID=B3RYH9_TRIAD|nr:hypothetical protein TRIADDRAFT_50321 [Trichoplax adhaerens]EDV24600.1 hypothetical protein TRIADDRAFT_50321 [Trichoplax adhaerens]|eukprot:XP_002112490.1 hypothetical protein TRIADDRAFT_50321 [Trichoplax adhaerens]
MINLYRWIVSEAKKDGADADIAKYDGQWEVEGTKKLINRGDLGLVMKSRAKHSAISTMLDQPFVFDTKPFIVQYEVQFQDFQECGGAYIKLLSASDKLKLEELHDKTPYTIMFGPDKCGEEKKLHFIFRHQNPVTNEFEEKHAKKPDVDIGKFFDDKTHLYKLAIFPDNTFKIFVDGELVNSGSLLEDFQPPVNPPEEIDDPDDKKPDEWDDREKIDDSDARKPDDWDEDEPMEIPDPAAVKPESWLDDEQQYIADPTAKKPDDWDAEMDGEWEPPLIDNPKCKESGCGEWKPPKIHNPKFKGKWIAPKIENPNYQGEWKPKKIKNPNYFNDEHPFTMTSIAALGFEIWSISPDICFDNILITSDEAAAEKGSFLSRFAEAAEEKPWLWVVYGIGLTVPFAILGYLCFPKKRDEAAERKRTDAPSPDDPQSSRRDKEEEESKETEKKKVPERK